MKKFKNMKLMLLGLLAMGSVNAFAGVGDLKTDGKYWYEVLDEGAAKVSFVGLSAVQNPTTKITIPATATLKDDQTNDKEYKVTAVFNGGTKWWDAKAGYTQAIPEVTELTFEMRIDKATGEDNSWDKTVQLALTQFGSNLESLVVKDAHLIASLPDLHSYSKLQTVDFSGVTNDGNAITLADHFIEDLTIKSIKLPNEPLIIGQFSLSGIKGPKDAAGNDTKVTVDLSKAIEFKTSALQGAYITEVVIGEDVTAIAADAFKAASSATAHLEKVTWKTNKIMGTSPALPTVPAGLFDGQDKLTEIIIAADKVNSIAANAFKDAKGNATVGTAVKNVKLTLTGSSVLKTIAGAFDATTQFESLDLEGAPLEGATLKDILGFDLAAANKTTLKVLKLSANVATLPTLTDYTALTTIGMKDTKITAIPDNAFKGCTALATAELPLATKSIGANAFEGTVLTGIVIPGEVTSIGDYAFANIHKAATGDGKSWWAAFTLDLSGAAKLSSLGTGAFFNTNVAGTVDFTPTQVYAIKDYTFAKTTSTVTTGGTTITPDFYGTGSNIAEKYFLEKVILKTGDMTSDPKKTVTIGTFAFFGNVWNGKDNSKGLKEVEGLNQAALTSIGTKAFQYTALTSANLADATSLNAAANKATISDYAFANIAALASVTLPSNVSIIGQHAFDGDINLATVENLNQASLTMIRLAAFSQSKIKKLDLSAATNLTTIGESSFEQRHYTDAAGNEVWEPALEEIIFPEETVSADNTGKFELYTNKISKISDQAFYGASKLKKIENLKDCKLSTIEQWFTTNKLADVDKKATDSGFDDQTALCPKGLTSLELPSAVWKSSDKPAVSLTKITSYSLQGLGIEEIVIPSSVSAFGKCVLQGCTSLKKFEWKDAQATSLHKYTFRGDSNLEEVYFMTTGVIASKGITDETFFWCSKDKLTVYVTAESLLQLLADGYTTANAKYSKLNDELEKNIKFSAAGKSGDVYYRTYFNRNYSTWFDAEKFEVYSAVIKGQKIETVLADVENGYYKVKALNGSTPVKEAVAIVKVKAADLDENLEIPVLYQALPANNISTMPALNDMRVAASETPVSSLKYQFKFGKNKNTGAFGFFRVTSGTIKKDGIYIEATSPLRGDFFAIDGDATAIESVNAAAESDAEVYNLQGVRVNGALQKGIYVKNGKKFIVK